MNSPDLTIATGCDVVHIPRFEALLTRTPAMKTRCFTPRELKQATSPQSLAGYYAAKEATIKALGLTLADLPVIEIAKGADQKPSVIVRGEATSISLSISHDGDYALAVAVVLKTKSQ